MVRRKKTIDDYDDDYEPDGSLKARIYDTYVLAPIEGVGIAYHDNAYITYNVSGTGEACKHFTNGYHRDAVSALLEVHRCVVNKRIIKRTKQKKQELELEEIKDVIIKCNKEFEKLWLALKAR